MVETDVKSNMDNQRKILYSVSLAFTLISALVLSWVYINNCNHVKSRDKLGVVSYPIMKFGSVTIPLMIFICSGMLSKLLHDRLNNLDTQDPVVLAKRTSMKIAVIVLLLISMIFVIFMDAYYSTSGIKIGSAPYIFYLVYILLFLSIFMTAITMI